MMPQGTDDSLRVDLVLQQPHAAAPRTRLWQFTGVARPISVPNQNSESLANNFKFDENFATWDGVIDHTRLERGALPASLQWQTACPTFPMTLTTFLAQVCSLCAPPHIKRTNLAHTSRDLFQGNQVLSSLCQTEGEKQESNSPSMASSCTLRLECPFLPSRPT
jgi:hypothetical protein